MRLAAIVRDESVVDHDILAAGALEARDLPVVIDLILVAQQQEGTEITDLLTLHVTLAANRPEHHAAAMIASRGERPSPGKPVAARDLLGLAGRVVRRGMHRCGIFAPYVALRPVVEQCELPRMHPDHAGDPSR